MGKKREEKPNDIRPISGLYYFDVSNMNYKRYMGVIAIAVLYKFIDRFITTQLEFLIKKNQHVFIYFLMNWNSQGDYFEMFWSKATMLKFKSKTVE